MDTLLTLVMWCAGIGGGVMALAFVFFVLIGLVAVFMGDSEAAAGSTVLIFTVGFGALMATGTAFLAHYLLQLV
jgi:hypothetical protein